MATPSTVSTPSPQPTPQPAPQPEPDTGPIATALIASLVQKVATLESRVSALETAKAEGA